MKDDLLLDRHLPGLGESKMSENQARPNLIDTTDCLEAVEVFNGWKNFFATIILICLIMLQGIFWLVDTGSVKTCDDNVQLVVAEVAVNPDNDKVDAPVIEPVVEEAAEDAKAEIDELEELKAAGLEVPEDISMAAKDVVAEPNQAALAEEVSEKTKFKIPAKITIQEVRATLRFVNFVLIIAAISYCLTLLFTLKVSLLGRLGGINHISRAFFLAFMMCIFLLPWQNMFGPMVSGMMFSTETLLKGYTECKNSSMFFMSLYYLRFVGYWLLVLLLLIFSFFRSRRWKRIIFRRLEVI